MTAETREQMRARWEREAEANEVAIRLGLAHRDYRHGVCYWRGNGAEFRAGYEAGKAAEREACAAICDRRYDWSANNIDGAEASACASAIRARGEPNGQSSKG